MGDLRFECWTLPWSATFQRVIADIPAVEGKGKGSVRFNDFGSASIAVPSDYTRLNEIISATVGTMIRVYDGTTIIQEFLAERLNFTIEENRVATISGDDLASAFDRARIYPFDYPNNPTSFPNHVWAGANVLTNPGFENSEERPTVYELWNDGATSDTFTATDGTDTTSAIAWDASASTVETRLKADITAYVDVIVTGEGTEDEPWTIQFSNPFDFDDVTLAINDTGMTSTLSTIVFGALQPTGWTKSQTVAQGTTVVFGEYTNFVVRTNFPDTGTYALFVNPKLIGRRYAGAQQVVNVKSGGTYQASLRIRPLSGTDLYRFVIRGVDGQFVASDSGGLNGTAYTVDTYSTITISDVVIPDGMSQIIFRISNVDAAPVDPAGFEIDNATFTEGAAAATVGTIVTSLMDDASADHSGDTRGTILDWIDYTGFDATNDSTTTAWDDSLSFTAFRGAPYGQVFDQLRELGYEWRLTPKVTPAGGLTHDLDWYNKDAAGTDHTSSATPAINVGQSTTAGPLVRRIPRYTAVLVEGEGGGYTEDKDATAETNFGRLETYHGDTTLGDSTTRTASADELLDAEADNRVAVQIRIVRNDAHPIPLVDYTPGDLISFQLPPQLAKESRRIQQITWRNTQPATYQVTGSRVFEGKAGAWENVRKLLRRFTPLTDPAPFVGSAIPLVGTGGGGVPTVMVAASDASEMSKSKADFQCTGTADQDVIMQAMDEFPSGIGGRVILSEGAYSLSATINIPAANMVHIEGAGWQAASLEMATAGINMITLNDFDTNLVLRDVQLNGLSKAGTGLLVSAGASLYVTHCQFININTTAIDSNAQFVNQAIDTLIQNAATGIIYRKDIGRGHITGNDFEDNTTDISILDSSATVVVANRSTGATTFLSRTAGPVYAWANDDGGAAYSGTITKGHNAEGLGDHSGVDHGTLAGTGDDDHTQYLLIDGTRAMTGALDVDQPSTSGAVPVITVDQADVDEDFFKFIGTSDTNVDRALVDAANFTTPGAIKGWLKINVQDDQATDPIVDGDYYIPFYAAPTV